MQSIYQRTLIKRFLERKAGTPQTITNKSVAMDRLWETPFTSLHTEGIDGVFTDSAQVDSLLDLLENLNNSAA